MRIYSNHAQIAQFESQIHPKRSPTDSMLRLKLMLRIQRQFIEELEWLRAGLHGWIWARVWCFNSAPNSTKNVTKAFKFLPKFARKVRLLMGKVEVGPKQVVWWKFEGFQSLVAVFIEEEKTTWWRWKTERWARGRGPSRLKEEDKGVSRDFTKMPLPFPLFFFVSSSPNT